MVIKAYLTPSKPWDCCWILKKSPSSAALGRIAIVTTACLCIEASKASWLCHNPVKRGPALITAGRLLVPMMRLHLLLQYLPDCGAAHT